MNRGVMYRCVPILCLLSVPGLHAEPSAAAQAEIAYLLATVGESHCKFYRNGIEYDAQRARAHLQQKYDYLLKRNLIDSAEDFIERAASKSSISGRPYEIECDCKTMPSAQWLKKVLANHRARDSENSRSPGR